MYHTEDFLSGIVETATLILMRTQVTHSDLTVSCGTVILLIQVNRQQDLTENRKIKILVSSVQPVDAFFRIKICSKDKN